MDTASHCISISHPTRSQHLHFLFIKHVHWERIHIPNRSTISSTQFKGAWNMTLLGFKSHAYIFLLDHSERRTKSRNAGGTGKREAGVERKSVTSKDGFRISWSLSQDSNASMAAWEPKAVAAREGTGQQQRAIEEGSRTSLVNCG